MNSRTYITGADSSQYDILRWFVGQFQKHTDINLAVYDFGLTETQALEIGAIEINNKRGLSGWFLKPVVLLQALETHEQVIWVDTDIEIVSNIDMLFGLLNDKILLADDVYAQMNYSPRMKNTGIVGVTSKCNNILERWVSVCQTGNKRGDQEALYLLLEAKNEWDKIEDMPIAFHGQRLDPRFDDEGRFLAKHWTGYIGKKYIREHLI